MLLFFLALIGAEVSSARAQDSAPADSIAPGDVAQDVAQLRLVAARSSLGNAETILLGLDIRLAPGWKTYWRSPGDAGLPTRIDWAGSRNLARAELLFPAPRRYSDYGLETIGYEGHVLLPVRAVLERPGAALSLKARVQYLVCRELCIPLTADLSLDLDAGEERESEFAAPLAEALARVPGAVSPEMSLDRLVTYAVDDKMFLEAEVSSTTPFDQPDLFVEGPETLRFGAPTVRLLEGGRRARLTIEAATRFKKHEPLAGAEVTLTLVDGARAFETRQKVIPGAPPSSSGAALAAMMALAVLGGFILNLMPCVLPVLSLKIAGVIGHGGREEKTVRESFLLSAAGILASFLLLALLAIALKSAGQAVGWGMQFQQPLFLIFMILLLVLFSANLFGFYEITLPGWIGNFALRAGGRGTGPGSGAGSGAGASRLGHFLTGAFATLLATPCTAPFLGTALGFALSRGAVEILLIFGALALGFGAPYLVLALFPALATSLPRPGKWMVILKALLGIGLLVTALWLLLVLSEAASARAALATGAFMALLGLLLWRYEAVAARLGARAAAVLLLALSLSPFFLPGRLAAPAGLVAGVVADGAPASAAAWPAFKREEIPALVAAGNVVLVDVTADWCLTCKVNRALVLEKDWLREMVQSGSLLVREADWTRPDRAIGEYLAGFGRYGIPFNVVYGPAAPHGVLLPELLSEKAVRAAIEKARGDGAKPPSPQK